MLNRSLALSALKQLTHAYTLQNYTEANNYATIL